MLFAKTEKARDGLKKQFELHSIQREYIALVQGCVESKSGTWKSALVEDDFYYVRSREGGKMAITHYQVERSNSRCTLLRVTLETGRKNQIRVHCSEAGHPVVGDKKYGATEHFLGRLGLHARLLGFTHPVTGKSMRFEVATPEFFSKIL